MGKASPAPVNFGSDLWWGLERQRYGAAWLAAVLLPVARGVGVFCVLPIGWHWLLRQRWGWLDRWSWLKEERRRIFGWRERGAGSEVVGRADAGRGESRSSPSAPLFMALAPPLGLGFVFLLMWHWTGNAWEGIEAQRFWGVHSMSNLWDVPEFVKGLAEPEVWHAFRGSVLDRCMFILLLYTVPLIWKMGKDMLWWTYALGVLPAMSGTFVSFTRFESVVFPLFIALAMFFTSFKRQWPLVVFAALMGAGHVWMLWRFVNFRWAG